MMDAILNCFKPDLAEGGAEGAEGGAEGAEGFLTTWF